MSSPTEPSADPTGLQPQPSMSEKFHASDADVIFQSSDNIIFRLHRKNLETHAAGFPPSEFSTNGETVPLTEDASTLEHLFQYIYPLRYPDIDLLPFEDLSKLAEAGEKYEVYSVMHICKLRMIQLKAEHPAEILNYAFKHDYPEIMELVVPHLLDLPLDKVVTILVPNLAIAWVCYREAWIRVAGEAIFASYTCPRIPIHQFAPQLGSYKLWFELGPVKTRLALSGISDTAVCSCGSQSFGGLSQNLNRKLDSVPNFATFLK